MTVYNTLLLFQFKQTELLMFVFFINVKLPINIESYIFIPCFTANFVSYLATHGPIKCSMKGCCYSDQCNQ